MRALRQCFINSFDDVFMKIELNIKLDCIGLFYPESVFEQEYGYCD